MARDADYFHHPQGPGQRRYEALRAYFVDHAPTKEAAERCGYTEGSFRVLCTRFRQGDIDPFPEPVRGGRPRKPIEALKERVVALRDQNLDIYEIEAELLREGVATNYHEVWRLLRAAGRGRLPRRTHAQKDQPRPTKAPTSGREALDLSHGRTMPCRAPLLFLFAPFLARLDWDDLVASAGYPSTTSLPAAHVTRSLLALKLLNQPRRHHVRAVAEDEGIGLFAGLNVLPKTTKLHDYSYEAPPQSHAALLKGALTRAHRAGLLAGTSFNLDTHAVRHYGAEAVLEKNYVPRRSQSTRSVLVVYSQELASRSLVYGTADVLKDEKVDAVLRFVDFWKDVGGLQPEELVFDSRLTTVAGLAKLRERGVTFLTLRARHPSLVQAALARPEGDWQRARIEVSRRKYKTPRVLDERVKVDGYPGTLRQIVARDLGKEAPMFLLTNDVDRKAGALLTRYALRTPIENSIGEQVKFFHVDALSSDVRLKVDQDVVLDVIASRCYHWLRGQLRGYEKATASWVWRRVLDREGAVAIGRDEVVVRVRPFSLTPVLKASSLVEQPERVPWLGNRRVRVEFKR